MADAHYNGCARHIEHYNEAVTSKGHAAVAAADAKVDGRSGKALSYEEATPVLQEANESIAAMLREQTDETLSNVLLTASLGMRNAFALSDH
jgi:dipeptidase